MKFISVRLVDGVRIEFETKFDSVNLFKFDTVDEVGIGFNYDIEADIHKLPLDSISNGGENSVSCIATISHGDISVVADYYIKTEDYTVISSTIDIEKFLLKEDFDTPCIRFNVELSDEEKIKLLCAIYKNT